MTLIASLDLTEALPNNNKWIKKHLIICSVPCLSGSLVTSYSQPVITNISRACLMTLVRVESTRAQCIPRHVTFQVYVSDLCYLMFPGQEFIVKHNVCEEQFTSRHWAFLCLLCERRLSEEEYFTHVFSREHVTKFLVSMNQLCKGTNCHS